MLPSPEKITANVKRLGFHKTAYNGADPLAVALRPLLKQKQCEDVVEECS